MKVSVGRQNHSPERDSVVVVDGGATITGGGLDYRQCNGRVIVIGIAMAKGKGEVGVGIRQRGEEGSGRERHIGIEAREIQKLPHTKSHGCLWRLRVLSKAVIHFSV